MAADDDGLCFGMVTRAARTGKVPPGGERDVLSSNAPDAAEGSYKMKMYRPTSSRTSVGGCGKVKRTSLR